jgi:ankyrin repeat protein
MFQRAFLQIEQISSIRLGSEIKKKLERLPKDLRDAYSESWLQIERLPATEQLFARRAILWVMAAERPFTTEQTLCAVRVNTDGEELLAEEPGGEGNLLAFCNNLLTVDTQQKVWRFSHLSVREYFEDHLGWRQSGAHLHAATTCLNFFLRADYKANEDRWAEASADVEQELSMTGKAIRDATSENKVSLESKYWKMNKRRYVEDRYWEIRNPMTQTKLVEDYDNGEEQMFDDRHPFHIYARHHLFKHIQSAQNDDDDNGSLGFLLHSFLGSPEESSPQFQKWYNSLDDNFSRIDPSNYAAAGYDADGTPLGHLAGTKRIRSFGVEWALTTMIRPERATIYAMCYFSLERVLGEWWANAEITKSRRNANQLNLLAIAARSGSGFICEALIKRGVDINDRNFSPVDMGAQQGHTETVKYLLACGAKVDALWAGSSFARAVSEPQENLETVKALWENGAKVDQEGSSSIIEKGSALASAACLGKVDVVRYLLDKGAVPNRLSNGKVSGGPHTTPLGWAALLGYVEIATVLLQKNANPNSVELKFGEDATPLALAKYAASDLGHPSCVKILEDYKALCGLQSVVNIRAQFQSDRAAAEEQIKGLRERGPAIIGTQHGSIPHSICGDE